MRRASSQLTTLALLAALAGCGGDAPTAPERAQLDGTYTLIGADTLTQGITITVTLAGEQVLDDRTTGLRRVSANGTGVLRRDGREAPLELCYFRRDELRTAAGGISAEESLLVLCSGTGSPQLIGLAGRIPRASNTLIAIPMGGGTTWLGFPPNSGVNTMLLLTRTR